MLRGGRTNTCNFLTEPIVVEASLLHKKVEQNREMTIYNGTCVFISQGLI
jgi:hypothetical protein